MEAKLHLDIVTPERQLLSVEADEVVIPGEDGYFGVLPGHHPLISTLGNGEVQYRQDGRRSYLAIQGGFAEVLANRVILLCDVAEKAEEIDLERAKQAERRARQRLENPPPDLDFARAQAALQRAVIREQVAKKAIRPPS
jgi:F-type H+-transporting ATPase subunit epsilon